MPYGAGTAFEGTYVYAGNQPTVLMDVSGKRGALPIDAGETSGVPNELALTQSPKKGPQDPKTKCINPSTRQDAPNPERSGFWSSMTLGAMNGTAEDGSLGAFGFLFKAVTSGCGFREVSLNIFPLQGTLSRLKIYVAQERKNAFYALRDESWTVGKSGGLRKLVSLQKYEQPFWFRLEFQPNSRGSGIAAKMNINSCNFDEKNRTLFMLARTNTSPSLPLI
jgi:hypothetical protein